MRWGVGQPGGRRLVLTIKRCNASSDSASPYFIVLIDDSKGFGGGDRDGDSLCLRNREFQES